MARRRIEFPDHDPLYRHHLTVRVSDINYGRHLGHDNLVSLLHEARIHLFRHLGAEEWDCDGLAMVVVELAVRYRAEAFLGQRLSIDIALGEAGGSGCELLYRVRHVDEDRVVADAATGIVFMDLATRRIAALPPTFRRLVEERRQPAQRSGGE